MEIRVIYNPNDKEKEQIVRAINIINQLQSQYSLLDESLEFNKFLCFQESVIDFERCADQLEYESGFNIFIVNVPFNDNWFSHEERHYSMITTADWNRHFAPPSLKSYLIYQIAQSLLNFTADIDEEIFMEKMVHYETSGCANDMCMNKTDIKIGIAAGFICPSCRSIFMQYGVSIKQLQSIETILLAARAEAIAKPIPESINIDEKRVFIVHGHNENILNMVSEFVDKIGLTPIILKRLARNGIDSILNQISENANVMCAILLFTADDKGCEITKRKTRKRARQNVVFEAGYFVGKLGKEKVIMMSEHDLEIPSDLDGCRYINLDSEMCWQRALYEDLKLMGLNPDSNF